MSADHYSDLRAALAVRGCRALQCHEDTIRALLNERDFLVAQRRLPAADTIHLGAIEADESVCSLSFTELAARRAA